jgi:hypothetical protein
LKKALISLLVLAVIALCVPVELAEGDNGTQEFSGNPVEAVEITAPASYSNMSMAIGDNLDNDSDADNMLVCKANVTYDIQVKMVPGGRVRGSALAAGARDGRCRQ